MVDRVELELAKHGEVWWKREAERLNEELSRVEREFAQERLRAEFLQGYKDAVESVLKKGVDRRGA